MSLSMVLTILCACGISEPSKECLPKGVVITVPGIGGFDLLNFNAKIVLPHCDVPHKIESFRWNHGLGRLLRDLQDTRHLKKKAKELAKRILKYKKADPRQPIYLIGHSAGTGLVLFTAELLPKNTLERIILLSPAVSAKYDLRPALRATRREIVSYSSKLDGVILGWGTKQFGTVDRVYEQSAGLEGFCVLDEKVPGAHLYRRLVQIHWKPSMLPFHGGMHHSTYMPLFMHRHLAPWLK